MGSKYSICLPVSVVSIWLLCDELLTINPRLWRGQIEWSNSLYGLLRMKSVTSRNLYLRNQIKYFTNDDAMVIMK